MNLGDVVFLQIPEKNIYYCKHNIFRSSIQMDTKDMSCFQTKLPKTKIFQFHWDKFSFVVSALLCWENSFSYIHLQFYLILWVCRPRKKAAILNTELMYMNTNWYFMIPFPVHMQEINISLNTHNI